MIAVGDQIAHAIQPQYLHQNPITYDDDTFKLSKEDEAIIAERLKSLGYLE